MLATPAASRTSEIAIFGHLIKSDDGDLSRELARYILTIGFGAEDQDRMRDLAARNQAGELPREEQEELQNYVNRSSRNACAWTTCARNKKSCRTTSRQGVC